MSTELPTLRLPKALLPADGRFGSGPSKVRRAAIEALAAAGPTYLGTSHRREGVRSVVRNVREGLRELFGLPDGYEVLLGNGGATAFWDACGYGLIERRSQHLVFGEFSARFAAAVDGAPHLDAPDVVSSQPGTHPEPRPDPSIDLYALTHNETSTGVMMEVRRPPSDGLVAVDATSGAGGLPVDPVEFDAYYFSPQKVFGADGGLWVALCSPQGVDRIEHIAASDRWVPPSLDLSIALENSRKNQTYNTPALATLFLLSDQVAWMLDGGGLDWAVGRCEASASIIYRWAEQSDYATPFVGRPEQRSRTVATIDLDEPIDASTVSTLLRQNGILDIHGYPKLGRNQLRIGLFPNIDPSDLEILTGAIDYVVERLDGPLP